MEWDRELSSNITSLYLLIVFIVLVYRRNKLDRNIDTYIASLFIVVFLETFLNFVKLKNNVIYYVLGSLLFHFLLLYVYYYQFLQTKKLKGLQMLIILLFLGNYMFFAIDDKTFFTVFPIKTYFVNIILLILSIGIFFYNTFNSEKIFSLKSYFPFWLSISLGVLYLGILPILVFSKLVGQEGQLSFSLYSFIMFTINMISYTILLVGIFKSKKIDLN